MMVYEPDIANPLLSIAFSCKDSGCDASEEISPTLRAMGHSGSHANAGGQVAIAFSGRNRGAEPSKGRPEREPLIKEECTGALDTVKPWNVAFQTSQSGTRVGAAHATLDSNNGSRRQNGAVTHQGVRRLTPRECERLQSWPDDHTLFRTKLRLGKDNLWVVLRDYVKDGKPEVVRQKDGPRYKQIGNSVTSNVPEWIARRIMEELKR